MAHPHNSESALRIFSKFCRMKGALGQVWVWAIVAGLSGSGNNPQLIDSFVIKYSRKDQVKFFIGVVNTS